MVTKLHNKEPVSFEWCHFLTITGSFHNHSVASIFEDWKGMYEKSLSGDVW